MKIALTYRQEEASAAARLIAQIRAKYPGSKLHKSERHPPFIHAYLTIGNVKNPRIHPGLC